MHRHSHSRILLNPNKTQISSDFQASNCSGVPAMASLTLARSSELSLCRSHVNGLSHTQSVCGEGLHHLKFTVLFAPRRTSIRAQPRMGNVNEGKGVFAPLVVVARNVIGKQRFNQLRGKAIALHSQVQISSSNILLLHTHSHARTQTQFSYVLPPFSSKVRSSFCC